MSKLCPWVIYGALSVFLEACFAFHKIIDTTDVVWLHCTGYIFHWVTRQKSRKKIVCISHFLAFHHLHAPECSAPMTIRCFVTVWFILSRWLLFLLISGKFWTRLRKSPLNFLKMLLLLFVCTGPSRFSGLWNHSLQPRSSWQKLSKRFIVIYLVEVPVGYFLSAMSHFTVSTFTRRWRSFSTYRSFVPVLRLVIS